MCTHVPLVSAFSGPPSSCPSLRLESSLVTCAARHICWRGVDTCSWKLIKADCTTHHLPGINREALQRIDEPCYKDHSLPGIAESAQLGLRSDTSGGDCPFTACQADAHSCGVEGAGYGLCFRSSGLCGKRGKEWRTAGWWPVHDNVGKEL